MSVSDVKGVNRMKEVKGIQIGFIGDGIKDFSKIDIFHDSTFALMLAAQDIKTRVLYAESNCLKIINNKVLAKFDEVTLRREPGNHIEVKNTVEYSLDSLNIIFARKDPPVNENFLSYLQMLTLVSKALIVNNPEGMLKANEKLYALNFPDFIPATLVSSSKNEILEFLDKHKEAVIKPLFDKGGEGIFYLNKSIQNTNAIIETSTQEETRLALVQKYIPEVTVGDKRIILLNGEPMGAILRIPKVGELRANMNRGASVKPCEISKRDLEICEALKPFLQKDGLYFTGIDVIGNYLTEVNVTSPTGIQEIEKLTGKSLAPEIIKWAVEKAINNSSLLSHH